MSKVVQTLKSQLDTVRSKWFELSKEIIEDEVGRKKIVNQNFDSDINVELKRTYTGYPFNSAEGRLVEAAVIGLQVEISMKFSLDQGYLTDDNTQDFMDAYAASLTEGSTWSFSIGTLFTEVSFDERVNDCFLVLSHYLFNTGMLTPEVKKVSNIFKENPLHFLAYLTWLGTAVAFGDSETAQELMRSADKYRNDS